MDEQQAANQFVNTLSNCNKGLEEFQRLVATYKLDMQKISDLVYDSKNMFIVLKEKYPMLHDWMIFVFTKAIKSTR